MSIDHDQSREKSVALSVELWEALSQWWENVSHEGDDKPVAPHLSAAFVVQSVGPTIYQYLTADADSSLETRVQVFRSTVGLFGHDDWASCARKTVEAHGGDGKSFTAFRVMSKNTKRKETKQLFLDLAKMSAELASKESLATVKAVASWGTEAPTATKKQKM